MVNTTPVTVAAFCPSPYHSHMRRACSVFDLRKMRVRGTVTNAHTRSIRCAALDPVGLSMATGSRDGNVKVCRVGVCVCLVDILLTVLRQQIWSLRAGDATTGGLLETQLLPGLHADKTFSRVSQTLLPVGCPHNACCQTNTTTPLCQCPPCSSLVVVSRASPAWC